MLWGKAKGDGIINAGKRLKGEKGKGINIRGRCTLDRVVSLKKRMTESQRKTVIGIVLGPILSIAHLRWSKT